MKTHMIQRLSFLTLVFLFWTATASAANLRAHMDTSVFHFSKEFLDFSTDDRSDELSVTSFGLGDSNDIVLDYELTQQTPLFRFGVGAVLHDNLTLGMTLGFGAARLKWAEEESEESSSSIDSEFSLFGFEVMPYISYKFGDGKIHPFVIASLGYKGSIFKLADDDDSERYMSHLFAFNGGGGIHFFITNAVSIDASAVVGGGIGKLVFKDDAPEDQKEKFPIKKVKANILLGLSGWF